MLLSDRLLVLRRPPRTMEAEMQWLIGLVTRPDWFSLILGGLVAWLIPLTPTLLGQIWAHLFNSRSAIEGDWICYHITKAGGKPRCIQSRVHIRKGIIHPYFAALTQESGGNGVYHGPVFRERDQLVFHYTSANDGSDRFVMMRFLDPAKRNANELFGFWQSFDQDQAVATGIVMLSSSPITGNVINYIRTGFEVSWRFGFMSVKKK